MAVSLTHRNAPPVSAEDLYERYGPRIRRVVKQKARAKPWLWDDLTQDVIAHIWMHVHQYDPNKAMWLTWMYRVVFNYLWKEWVTSTRKGRLQYADSLDADMNHDSTDPYTLADQLGEDDLSYREVESRDRFRYLIAPLTPDQQRVMRLIYEDDLAPVEIARRLGTSRQNIDNLHRNGIVSLRNYARGSKAWLMGESLYG